MTGAENIFEFGPFRLEPAERRLLRAGETVALTEKVFELLLLLVQNQGHALSKSELMDRLWPDAVVEENNLTVNISILRKALGDGANERRYIETLPRRGYRFVADVRRASLPPRAEPARDAPSAEISSADPPSSAFGQAFVGRERELGQLDDLLSSARAGRGQLVLLSGNPGMGKTALCDHFVARLRRADEVLLARGHCFEWFGAVEAYLPFLEVLQTLLQDNERDAVARALRRHAPTWCAQFPGTLGGVEAVSSLPNDQGGTSSARMVRELCDLLEAVSTLKPLVLVLEDMHWADSSSLDVLQLLARRIARFRALALVTYRAHELQTEAQPLKNIRRELLAHDRALELDLPLLDEAGIVRHLALRFPHNDFSAELATLILKTTEGQPLFATRLVQLLVERGDIRQTAGVWTLSVPPGALKVDVPASVRGVIERKLESLTAEDQRALGYASVAGTEFTSALLAALVEQNEAELEERLDRLARSRDLLERLGEERLAGGRVTLRYRFAHVLYRQVLYDRTAIKRRVELHAEIAERLIEQYAPALDRVVAQIALHFESGRCFARAIEYWQRVADNAGRLQAMREAHRHYARALELVQELEPSDRVAPSIILHYNHGWCTSNLGDHWRAVADFERMLELASSAAFGAETAAGASARARVFDYFEEPWRDPFGIREMERMPNQARSLGATAIMCEAYWGLGYTLFWSDRLEEMGRRNREFLELAERSGNEPRRIEALAWMAVRAIQVSSVEEAIQLADESIAAAERIGHRRALFLAMHARSQAHRRLGEYSRAEALLTNCLELAFEVQTRLTCLLDIGRSCSKRGAVSGALSVLATAADIAERSEQPLWAVRVALANAELYLELENFQRADESLLRALERAQALHKAEFVTQCWQKLARCRLEAAKLGVPLATSEAPRGLGGVELAEDAQPTRPFRGELASVQYESASYRLARGELDAAERHAKALLELSRAGNAVSQSASAHALLSRIALERGEVSRARAEAQHGLECLGTHELPFIQIRLRAALGAALLEEGDRPRAHEVFEAAKEDCALIAAAIADDALRAAWQSSSLVTGIAAGADSSRSAKPAG